MEKKLQCHITVWKPIKELDPIALIDALNLQAEMSLLSEMINGMFWGNFWGYEVYNYILGGKLPRQSKRQRISYDKNGALKCLENIKALHVKSQIFLGHEYDRYCSLEEWKLEYSELAKLTKLKPIE